MEFYTLYKTPVFVLLDAYDELDSTDEHLNGERERFTSYLKDLNNEPGIRILNSTRPDFRNRLEAAFVKSRSVAIKSHESDIEIYIRKRLSNYGFSGELKTKIVETIKVQGKGW
jgi:hypothetical protein